MSWVIGKQEENVAVAYLTKQGLQILFRNYHCRGGELDIVAMHNCELDFVEVRYRKLTAWGDAVESVNVTKQQRWVHAAQCFCLQHPEFDDLTKRFDLIAIQGANNWFHTSKTIRWMRNVLQLDA